MWFSTRRVANVTAYVLSMRFVDSRDNLAFDPD